LKTKKETTERRLNKTAKLKVQNMHFPFLLESSIEAFPSPELVISLNKAQPQKKHISHISQTVTYRKPKTSLDMHHQEENCSSPQDAPEPF
jgi:hypothetical protein